jgi:hypothetical protein
MYSVVTLAALSVLVGFPDRPDKPRKPGPPPVIGRASLNQKGWVSVQETFWNEEEEFGTRRQVPYTWINIYPLEKVRAYLVDGTPVGPKALARILKKGTSVLVSADGNKVHPVHLRGVKKGTFILVLPRSNWKIFGLRR